MVCIGTHLFALKNNRKENMTNANHAKRRKEKHLRARMGRDNGTNKKSEERKQEYCADMSVSSNCSAFLSSRCALDKTGNSKLSSSLMRTIVVYGRSVSPHVRVFATCYVCNILFFSWRYNPHWELYFTAL